MRFGVITDCQYADIDDLKTNEFDRRFRTSDKKLQEAINFFNTQDLEFVVHLGDLIDQNLNNLEQLRKILDSSKHKIYHVLGNHDFYVRYDTDPERNNHQQLLDFLNMPSKYYSFTNDKIRFLVLDTNEVGVIEWGAGSNEYIQGLKVVESEKEAGKIYAQRWNGALSEEQLNWLEKEIDSAATKGQKVILFAHHQLFPEHRENMLQKEKILQLLTKKRNIVAFMNGHNHLGDYGVYDDVPCITFKGMVETEKNSYSTVYLNGNELSIEGFGRELSRNIKTREV